MRCVECGGEMMLVTSPVTESIHGEEYVIPDVRRWECQDCHEYEMDIKDADRLGRELSARYAAAHGILEPDEIKSLRASLGLGQAEFGRLIEANAQTVCRWERGRVMQDARANRLMVLLRDCPEARDALVEITDSMARKVSAG